MTQRLTNSQVADEWFCAECGQLIPESEKALRRVPTTRDFYKVERLEKVHFECLRTFEREFYRERVERLRAAVSDAK